MKRRTGRVYFTAGTSKAGELGDIRTLNMFMLGCVSSFLPIGIDIWKDCISQRLPSKILQINITAFNQGREETSNVNLR